MGFAEKFVASLQSSNLRDDAFHHDLDAIAAAALAGDLGSLLCRVKYADGTINRLFEGNSGNLAQLLRIWTAAVTEKGKARRWVKINSERDVFTAHALYKRVAHASLAPWLLGSLARWAVQVLQWHWCVAQEFTWLRYVLWERPGRRCVCRRIRAGAH
ncbi:hypothetical protein [Janthinobacterium lividum]|uniref:hypothetical protein n=1 Tax=Janthinobacterium lividum TaxID=29581 RepID=UPI00201387FA|nr:hypothetical protein [Janthinobacterium lividum]